MRKIFVLIFALFSLFIFSGENVDAYSNMCVGEEILTDGKELLVCNNNVYLNKENISTSSYLKAEIDFKYRKGKILYAGKIDGIETFYSSGFNYFAVVYDNNGLFRRDDAYSVLSINGEIVYNGKFEDSVLVDQSYRRNLNFFNEVGEYKVIQYVNGEVQSVIRVIVNRFDYDVNIKEVKYGDELVSQPDLTFDRNKSLSFNFEGGSYGYGNKVSLSINSCDKQLIFSNPLVIGGESLASCLSLNGNNSIQITVSDGLDKTKTFNFNFNLYTNFVSIKLEDSISKIVTTSRRIVIKASPSLGNELDSESSLYYWSTNAGDKLTYEDFMGNYAKSENKGSYATNNAVILRDSNGTYYLYALAKDSSGQSVVLRSDEYILEKSKMVNKVTFGDILLVVGFCVAAAVPIFVYLLIRGKDSV